MNIEILHVRNPDGDCTVRVFVDGVEAPADEFEDIDPGRGCDMKEYAERVAMLQDMTPTPYNLAALEELKEAKDEFERWAL